MKCLRLAWSRVAASLRKPKTWRRIQGVLTIVWLILIVPSVLWWRESIPWLVFMSVWANVAGHVSAWQAARAEDNNNS